MYSHFKVNQIKSQSDRPRCCVLKCRKTRKDGVHFHTFPMDKIRQKVWVDIVRKANNTREDDKSGVTIRSKICNEHFSINQYQMRSILLNEEKKSLLPTAFPNVFENQEQVSCTPNANDVALTILPQSFCDIEASTSTEPPIKRTRTIMELTDNDNIVTSKLLKRLPSTRVKCIQTMKVRSYSIGLQVGSDLRSISIQTKFGPNRASFGTQTNFSDRNTKGISVEMNNQSCFQTFRNFFLTAKRKNQKRSRTPKSSIPDLQSLSSYQPSPTQSSRVLMPSEEERKRRKIETQRLRRANMTEQQRAREKERRVEREKKRLASMTDDDRTHEREKHAERERKRLANMNDEDRALERKRHAEQERNRLANMNADDRAHERKRHAEHKRKRLANMNDDDRAHVRKTHAEQERNRLANMNDDNQTHERERHAEQERNCLGDMNNEFHNFQLNWHLL